MTVSTGFPSPAGAPSSLDMFDLRPCQHNNGYMDGRSQIKVHADGRTMVRSAKSSLAVTHSSTNRAWRYLTSVFESPSKHWSPLRTPRTCRMFSEGYYVTFVYNILCMTRLHGESRVARCLRKVAHAIILGIITQKLRFINYGRRFPVSKRPAKQS